jgi:elongation factor G
LDGAVALFCAVGAVQPQSETVWRQADKYGLPRICFINKMDRTGADFFAAVNEIKEKLHGNPVPLQIPIGSEESFAGVVDLIEKKAYVWNEEDKGVSYEEYEIPEDLLEEVEQYRTNLLETLAGYDDLLMTKYFDDPNSITEDEILSALRKATLNLQIQPVLCGSSFKNKGVQRLLDAVVQFLPSPLDVPPVKGVNPETEEEVIVKTDPEASFAALAFKIATDPYVGKLTFIKLYSGVLNVGDIVYNMTAGKKERVSKILQMHSNKQQQINHVQAGDIVALVGMKTIRTGDSLVDQHHQLILENIEFPEPVITIAVEPKTQDDIDKLMDALSKLAEEDPTFVVRVDEESNQTVISGMGELHLDILLDRIKREFGVACNHGKPKVAYREAFIAPLTHREVYKRQSGGRGSFADITFEIHPLPFDEKGIVFENKAKGGVIPKEYAAGAEKGFKTAMMNGKHGFQMENLSVTLIDGNTHPVDSDALSFEICAKIGFRESCKETETAILEPVMRVEITTPDEYIGNITGDLNRRRAIVEEIAGKANYQVIKAQVPLAEMFGYVTHLRSISSGRASYCMDFLKYAEIPADVKEELLTKGKYLL